MYINRTIVPLVVMIIVCPTTAGRDHVHQQNNSTSNATIVLSITIDNNHVNRTTVPLVLWLSSRPRWHRWDTEYGNPTRLKRWWARFVYCRFVFLNIPSALNL